MSNATPTATDLADAELIEEAMLCASRYAQATASLDAEGRAMYRVRGDQCSAELLRRLGAGSHLTTRRKMIALDWECGKILSEFAQFGGQITSNELGSAINQLDAALSGATDGQPADGPTEDEG